MIIRPADSSDAEQIFTLAAAFATSSTPDHTTFSESFSKLIDDASTRLLVAETDGEIAGYCLAFDHLTFYANGRVTWVAEIMIKAELRRRGIGQALMDAAEQWAATRGSKMVALASRRAAPFYLALGYEESASYFRKRITP